jgi:hypothetical protein
MFDKVTDLFSAISRVPTQFLLAVAVAGGLVLFVPDQVASLLAVGEFRDAFRIYLGPSFLLVISWIVMRTFSRIQRRFEAAARQRRRCGLLETLTPEEQGYLVAYIAEDRTTIYLPIDDGIIGGLLARNIVYRSSSLVDPFNGVPYNLQPWARSHLRANEHLLADAAGRPLGPQDLRTMWGP